MKPSCPRETCRQFKPKRRYHGKYYRKSDRTQVTRWVCLGCRRTFTSGTFGPEFKQRRRDLNSKVFKCLVSGVSMNQTARLLNTDYKTVARKLKYLANRCRNERNELIKLVSRRPQPEIQFDDMETMIHTKLKPASIAVAVNSNRFILCAYANIMPAKGKLAHKSRKKYGPRPDERPKGWQWLMETIQPLVKKYTVILSDKNPHYKKFTKHYFPENTHMTVKGRRGCVVGQGELKEGGRDPLFNLNHSCASFRAGVSRLIRRTWNTTKKIEALQDHLELFISKHNQMIVKQLIKQDFWSGITI